MIALPVVTGRYSSGGREPESSQRLTVPKIDPYSETVTLAKWLKQPGDLVHKDEAVATLETNSTTAVLCAPCAGRVSESRVPDGTVLDVGATAGMLRAVDPVILEPYLGCVRHLVGRTVEVIYSNKQHVYFRHENRIQSWPKDSLSTSSSMTRRAFILRCLTELPWVRRGFGNLTNLAPVFEKMKELVQAEGHAQWWEGISLSDRLPMAHAILYLSQRGFNRSDWTFDQYLETSTWWRSRTPEIKAEVRALVQSCIDGALRLPEVVTVYPCDLINVKGQHLPYELKVVRGSRQLRIYHEIDDVSSKVDVYATAHAELTIDGEVIFNEPVSARFRYDRELGHVDLLGRRVKSETLVDVYLPRPRS